MASQHSLDRKLLAAAADTEVDNVADYEVTRSGLLLCLCLVFHRDVVWRTETLEESSLQDWNHQSDWLDVQIVRWRQRLGRTALAYVLRICVAFLLFPLWLELWHLLGLSALQRRLLHPRMIHLCR